MTAIGDMFETIGVCRMILQQCAMKTEKNTENGNKMEKYFTTEITLLCLEEGFFYNRGAGTAHQKYWGSN